MTVRPGRRPGLRPAARARARWRARSAAGVEVQDADRQQASSVVDRRVALVGDPRGLGRAWGGPARDAKRSGVDVIVAARMT